MIVDRLVLENFKRFRDQEIRFQDGITGILGNNGSGKSSIVQAIFFALYGVLGTGITPDHIVSSFASPRERCSVRLDFRIGGEPYTVIRTFRKGKTVQHDVSLYKGTSKLATGVNTVDTEVRRILGMGPVDFRNTIYAAQKDLLTLLENTPGKRKEWFLRALGLDYLNNESQKLLKDRIDGWERDLQLAEGEMKGLMERQDPQEIPHLMSTVQSLRETIKALDLSHVEQIAKKEQIEAERRQFQERKIEHTRLIESHRSLSIETAGLVLQREQVRTQLKDLVLLEKEYQDLERLLSTYPDKKKERDTLRQLKVESDRITAEYRFAERDIADRHLRTEKLRAKMNSLDKEAERMAALGDSIREHSGIDRDVSDAMLEQAIALQHAEIQHYIGMLSGQQKNLVTERQTLLSEREAIRKAGPDGVCPLCRQTLGGHYSSIEQEFDNRLDTIHTQALHLCEEQDRAVAIRDRIDQIMPILGEMRSLAERLKTRDTIESELLDLTTALNSRELERQALARRIKDLGFDATACDHLDKEVSGLEMMQERYSEMGRKIGQGTALRQLLTDLEKTIDRKRRELAELDSLIARSPFNPADEARLSARSTEIDTAMRKTEGEIARNGERILHAEERIEGCKKVGDQIARLSERIERLKDDTDLLRLTRSVIADYVVYLMQVVRSRLEMEVGRIVSEITGGRYEQVLLDEDFNLLVRDIDNDYSVDRFSGGEQDDIAVSLRIALSRYLAELHQMQESTLLIFDEIFGSQDEERRSNLLTALRTQESRFPQIILISHMSEIQGEFTTTLLVEMGSDQTSTVREVQGIA